MQVNLDLLLVGAVDHQVAVCKSDEMVVRVELGSVEFEEGYILEGLYLALLVNIAETFAGCMVFLDFGLEVRGDVSVLPDEGVGVETVEIGAVFVDEQ